MGGRDGNGYLALVIKCFKVKENMVTVSLEQKSTETNLDLIPSQRIIKTTVTTSHQSDASLGKSELSVVC